MYCANTEQKEIDWRELERAKERAREKARESQKRRRDYARKRGMCSICCKRPAEAGHKTCHVCIARAKAYKVKRG